MYSLTLLIPLFVVCSSAEFGQRYSNAGHDGSYSFSFDTGSVGGQHSRQESRSADGTVVGSFSYSDPTGDRRTVQYRSGEGGYVASGHVGAVGAPKSQLPLYDVGYPQGDSEPQVDVPPESSEGSTVAPDPSQKETVPEEEVPEQDLGYFVLGLGGKRRLEKPSDTGILNSPLELSQPKHPITLYRVVDIPYGYYPRRQFLLPHYQPIPYVPYVTYLHAIRSPTRDLPTKSIFRSYPPY